VLIDDDNLDIECSEWHPGDEDWVAKASVAADLTPVMPYINAVVKRPEYYPDLPAVIWRIEDRQFAVRPHEIAVNRIVDREAAAEEVARLVSWINDLWERRSEITPSEEPKSPPPLMSVLKLLPMNNCGDCALPTCTAFAVKLIEGEKSIEDCPALVRDESLENASALREMGLA
jgi:ArsR family metal-binding transcriptional regulator